MDWTARVSQAVESAAVAPDGDLIDELARHAAATYNAARADGATEEEAHARVAVFRRRPYRAAIHRDDC